LTTISLRLTFAALLLTLASTARSQQPSPGTVRLPEPRRQGTVSLEAALQSRHSTRALSRDSLSLADVAQLLWATQGVNRPDGHRTAPSAGATYALELYLVATRVRDLPAGVYHYRPAGHEIETVASGDRLPELVSAATRQAWMADAAATVVFAAVYERTAQRYAARADRYVPMEVGFAAQNLYLQAAALGLGTTFAGSYQDTALARIVGLPENHRPLGIMPVGHPR
jgi:SagB-type dehydrogenase family enzyme